MSAERKKRAAVLEAGSPGLVASVALPQETEITERQSFIETSAIALGRCWARRWREDLHREGRAAAGGWPGTLCEARARVGQSILHEMRRLKMPAITEAERELAARTAYASARVEWRRHLDPEVP